MEAKPKKAGRPKKTAEVNDSAHAIIKVSLSMPGKTPHEFTVTVDNVNGKYIGSQRNPETFEKIIRGELNSL